MMDKPKTVDGYIAVFSKEIQQRLNQIRNTFRNTFLTVEEKIRYDMPAFKVGREHLYVSAYKKHLVCILSTA